MCHLHSGYNLTASYAWKLVVANVDWNTARRNCVKDGGASQICLLLQNQYLTKEKKY